MTTLTLLIFVLNVFLVNAGIPTFDDRYIINGRILLPYAEIDEPFVAYYDKVANKSRIDYYDDLQLTLQRPDLKKFYKIAYMVDNGKTTRVCFDMAESPIAPVAIQNVIPDLSNFELKKRDMCKNFAKLKSLKSSTQNCEQWEYRVSYGQKDNKYVFILRRDSNGKALPAYYLMMGYDSLMGSHYDKYELLYESYWSGTIDQKLFDIHQNYQCRNFPGPGKQALALMNPIREFVLNDYDHIDQHFGQFVTKHNKNYSLSNEIHFRKSVFLQNYRFIMAQNRKNLHYKLAINHLADRTDEEIGKIRGRISITDNNYDGGLLFDKNKYDRSKIPSQWDWRLLGAVNPVKDQAICGSCWSFGTTGSIEGVYFVKTGRLLKLSQQQLIDCSWSEKNNGCDGGQDFRTYNYIQKAGGIATEEDYGHYLGVDGKCHDYSVKKSVQIKGFYNITMGDAESLKTALYYHGPVTIAIDASPKTFSFYSNGIYYDPKCSSKDLDHQVLVVGFGELNNQKYWLVKNSWSTYWGNDGYVLINQKNNNCGVLTDATFPLIE